MKLSHTALLASCLLAGQAHAQLQSPIFYGDLRFSLTQADTAFAANPSGSDGTTLQNDFSYVGLRGSSALTEQLALIYKAEVMLNGDDTDDNSPFKARDIFVGLQSDWGTVSFGKMLTVFLKSEGSIDQFNLTNTDINRLFAGQDRMGDMVEFSSAEFANSRVLVNYLLEDDAEDKNNNKTNLGDPFAVSLLHGDKSFKKQPYFFSAAYNDGLKQERMWRLVSQVKLGQWQLGALYQDTQDLKYNNLDGSGFVLSANYPLNDKLKFKARYGQDDSGNGKYIDKVIQHVKLDSSDVAATQVTNYSIGLDYQISRSTKVFTHFSYFDAEVDHINGERVYDADDKLFNLGLWYKF
ncbi:porin [Ferrimonas senticii]|uniref:porin n=1 Tax=Ferrimonas senticii TaxID=394566 RepID=UPI00146ED064|nr:porin [Ferrimonas senticii]